MTDPNDTPQADPPALEEGQETVSFEELMESAPAQMLPANTPVPIVMQRLAAAADIAPEGLVKDAIGLAHEKLRWLPHSDSLAQRELDKANTRIKVLEQQLSDRSNLVNDQRNQLMELQEEVARVRNLLGQAQSSAVSEQHPALANALADNAHLRGLLLTLSRDLSVSAATVLDGLVGDAD